MPEPNPAEAKPVSPSQDAQLAFEREYIAQLQKYEDLKYKVSLGLLVACPALALVPPRKLDWYTFGLGSAWLLCLDGVTNAHGRNMWRGFRRTEGIDRSVARKPEAEGVEVVGWKGEKITKDTRHHREEEAENVGSLILEQVWDAWEQKDRDRKNKKDEPEVGMEEEVWKRFEEKKDGRGSDKE